ncbi:hypothetical protein ND447_07265 [Yersinia ruckeri]|uniref:hypothetical protein n=1 Tax=Yersinia ruckeri TaxID=29486 RepID=UPI00226465DA|nr:hypothetical protein [Yersinia ruckeri]UZX73114.1 hypothetical protein ND447_07265 [Yersinia ruckeri]
MRISGVGTLLLFATLSSSVLANTLHCPKVESIQSGAVSIRHKHKAVNGWG